MNPASHSPELAECDIRKHPVESQFHSRRPISPGSSKQIGIGRNLVFRGRIERAEMRSNRSLTTTKHAQIAAQPRNIGAHRSRRKPLVDNVDSKTACCATTGDKKTG